MDCSLLSCSIYWFTKYSCKLFTSQREQGDRKHPSYALFKYGLHFYCCHTTHSRYTMCLGSPPVTEVSNNFSQKGNFLAEFIPEIWFTAELYRLLIVLKKYFLSSDPGSSLHDLEVRGLEMKWNRTLLQKSLEWIPWDGFLYVQIWKWGSARLAPWLSSPAADEYASHTMWSTPTVPLKTAYPS